MRVSVSLALVLLLASTLAGQTGSPNPNPGEARTSVADLPPLAQYAISAAIGRDQTAYHVTPSTDGLRAVNDAQSLTADFAAEGITVRTSTAQFGLRLDAVGRGDTLTLLAAGERRASKNRVEYRRGQLVEWYVNGPRGLQQGFTLDRAPRTKGSGPVTLALACDHEITVDADGRGATLTRRDGGATLRYTGLTAYDATGRTLDATLAVSGERLLIRVDDTDAEYPVVVDPIFEAAKLTASDAAPGDQFGASVSISGNTVVVGAPEEFAVRTGEGAAYVFVKPAAGWNSTIEVAKLTALSRYLVGRFGGSVSISGDTIVVGARGDNGLRGAAYVFVKPAAGWKTTIETARLTASDVASRDEFGASVSISGDTVVVGADKDDDNGMDSGSAYVFVKPAAGWKSMTETAKLTPSDGAAFDRFGGGGSAAISGGTIVIGAWLHDIGLNANQGSAFVFVKPAAGWQTTIETAKLTASDGAASDYFGVGAAIDGDTIVVGARVSSSVLNRLGSAYIFVKPAAGWTSMTETAKLTASDGAVNDQFGIEVAISGDTVVVGARRDDVGSNTDQGSTYLFLKPAAGWKSMTETAKLTASDGAAEDEFGESVAISGDTVVSGAIQSTSPAGPGKAYVHCLATVTGSGSGQIGTTMNLALRAVCDAGLTYQLASSFGTGPIPIGSRTIPLSADGLFFGSLLKLFPLFNGYSGMLDGSGNASASLLIPNIAPLAGIQIHSAFLTLKASAPNGIQSISDAFSFRVQP